MFQLGVLFALLLQTKARKTLHCASATLRISGTPCLVHACGSEIKLACMSGSPSHGSPSASLACTQIVSNALRAASTLYSSVSIWKIARLPVDQLQRRTRSGRANLTFPRVLDSPSGPDSIPCGQRVSVRSQRLSPEDASRTASISHSAEYERDLYPNYRDRARR